MRFLKKSLIGILSVLLIFSGNAVISNAQTPIHKTSIPPLCTPSKFGYGLLDCQVYSPAMKVNIKVQIRPGNSHQILFLDGARAQEDYNMFAQPKEVNALPVLKNNPSTLVFICGGFGSWFTNWSFRAPTQKHIYKWQTFITEELPLYLSKTFNVEPHNGTIVGVSMSAVSGIVLSANSNLFNHVLALSGVYPAIAFQASETFIFNLSISGTGSISQWGFPYLTKAWYDNNLLLALGKLSKKGISVSFAAGTGVPDKQYPTQILLAGSALEILSKQSTDWYMGMAQIAGVKVFDLREEYTGIHEPGLWHRGLVRDLPNL